MERLRIGARACIFCGIACLLFGVVNVIASPVWLDWNNYNTTYGFYEEPNNTIETIFLGSSVTVNGIIPMELYEKYGISSYNLGTEQQPMLASYYWLEEAYRLHSDTLDTVVLDVSMMRRTPDEAFFHKALDAMQLSKVKYHAVKEYTDDFKKMLSELIPVLSYHDRWKSLADSDFLKMDYDAELYTRGYNYNAGRYLSYIGDATLIAQPPYLEDAQAGETVLDSYSLLYLKRMMQFCAAHEIRFVLMKTPIFSDASWARGWTSADHNAVQKIADSYQLDFFDFNFWPYIDEIEYSNATDTFDGYHLNYSGARKLTSWFGRYLARSCGNRDVRGEERYAFLEEELMQYKRSIVGAGLGRITDPAAYLSYFADKEQYTIFVSVMDDASENLLAEQREKFANLGLGGLLKLSYRDSYLGIINNNIIEIEELKRYNEEEILEKSEEVSEQYEINDLEHIEELIAREESERDAKEEQAVGKERKQQQEQFLPLTVEGRLPDGKEYKLTSGGFVSGCIASCEIDGVEYAPNQRGLNIVVYDHVLKKVVDTAVFDTFASPVRESKIIEESLDQALAEGKTFSELSPLEQQLWLYNQACEERRSALLQSLATVG